MGMMTLEACNNNLNQPMTNAIGDWNTWQPLVNTFYHYYPHTYWSFTEPNRFEQAFKILQKLMDKKLIEIKTVKQFIETLGDIQSVL